VNLHQLFLLQLYSQSFSSIWFWFSFVLIWGLIIYFPMGISIRLLMCAQELGDQAQRDIANVVQIQAIRFTHFGLAKGVWVLGLVSFFLTVLLIVGLRLNIEFFVALSFLFFPLLLVGILTFKTGVHIALDKLEGHALIETLKDHQIRLMLSGVLALFCFVCWQFFLTVEWYYWLGFAEF